MSVFKDKYAHCYDLLYQSKDYKKECFYLKNIFKKYSKKKVDSILNLGCGTGSHDIHLAKMDYKMSGVDLSSNMLLHAKRKARGQKLDIAFKKGNIQNVALNKKFDAVISMFAVMGYQTSNEGFLAALKNAHRHLKPGGIFVFDCWYGPAVLSDQPKFARKIVSDGTFKVSRTASPRLIAEKNLVEVNYNLTLSENGQKRKERFSEKHYMRYFFVPEIEFFLEKVGFELLATHDYLSFKDPSIKSWNFAVVARK